MKPRRTVSEKEITYSEEDWDRFERFRKETREILKAIGEFGLNGLAHGSIARGDLNEDSDIDVILPDPEPSYKVELALEEKGFHPSGKKIVMATPWQLPKAHIPLEENKIVTFPLEKPKKLEEDFYKFGGAVGLGQVKEGKRVPGVDKRLILIEPTENGHRESQVMGREGEVAKLLDVDIEIVEERIQILTQRDEIGRTGVFLEKEIGPEENFESEWRRITEENPRITR